MGESAKTQTEERWGMLLDYHRHFFDGEPGKDAKDSYLRQAQSQLPNEEWLRKVLKREQVRERLRNYRERLNGELGLLVAKR